MNKDDLSEEEIAILHGFRKLNEARKKAVIASENAFINWIKTSFEWVWDKISAYARDLWSWFVSVL
jgi:hypothetical protein